MASRNHMRKPTSQLTGMLRVLVSMNARAGRLVLFLSLSLVIAWGWRDGSRLTPGVFAQAPGRDSAPDLAWIGPPGPWLVDRLAASPDGRVIVARRSVHLADREELVRTRDGGATWERIPFPAGYDDVPNRHMARLRLEIRQHGDELVLLLSMGRKERHQVIRSTDLGTTWQTVANITTAEFEQPELVLSPTFEADGIALLVTERQLWRTTDAGRTWAVAAEPTDRLIRQAAFSPVFAEDHRALLLLSPTGIYSESPPATAPTVLMSADSGASWSPLPADPLPTDLERPVVSGVWFEPPMGAAGGLPPSLLALVGNQPTQRAETSRLLRSSDGGATWNMIAPVPLRPHWDLAPLAFSPGYAQDGVTVVGEAHTCQMARTADGGASWQPVTVTVPGASGNLRCNSLRHLTHDGTAFLAGFEVESDTTAFNSRWLRSAD
ncbi:MAG: WD40/YVTN/BNR-like repeat-containing protein, partial [Chloroflexota bacterium]